MKKKFPSAMLSINYEDSTANTEERNYMIPIVVSVILLLLVGGGTFMMTSLMNAKPKEFVATRDEKEIVDPHKEAFIGDELTGSKVDYTQKEGYMHPNNVLGYLDEDMKTLQGKNYTAVSFLGTGIDGSGLIHIKDEPIRRLSLDYTRINDETMALINKLFPNLWGLHVEYTQISNAGVYKLTDLKNLHHFTLNGTRVDDEVVPFIVKSFPKLVKLSFVKTKVTDEGMKPLKDMKNLQTFYMDGTKLGDKTIDIVSKHPLSTLSFSSTLVSDKSLPKIAKIKTLEFLSLANCSRITETGLKKFRKARPDVKIIRENFFDPLNVSF